MGWTVDGTNVVDISSYKITAATTFTAKFGSWTVIYDGMVYAGSSAGAHSLEVNISGLKKGDKIKFSTPSFTVNDGRYFAGEGFNNWEGFNYVGAGNGNFGENNEWFENSPDDIGWSGEEFYFYSEEPVTTCVGRKDWSENNYMTFTVSCKKDGMLTIEWTDQADFYIQNIGIWRLSVLR